MSFMPSTTQLEAKEQLGTTDLDRSSPTFELKANSEFADLMKLSPSTEQHEQHNLPIIKKEYDALQSFEQCSQTTSPRVPPDNYSNHRAPPPYNATNMLPPPYTSGAPVTTTEQQFFNNTTALATETNSPLITDPLNHPVIRGVTRNIVPKTTGRRKPRNTYTTHRGRRPWGDEQRRRTELIVAQRSKEWKARQVMWKSGFSSYHFVAPPSPTEAMPYAHEGNHYPLLRDEMYYGGGRRFDDMIAEQEPSAMMLIEQGHGSPVVANGVEKNPVIQEVVSLAETQESKLNAVTDNRTRAKKPRKIYDDQESSDSGTSEVDDNPGKYISDLARPFVNIPDDHQVAHINGLLSLPSNRETRYGITYGELKRRCNPPESLTRVDLVAYVRHSKSSGRNLLDKYRIVSANRNSRPTILSKMCENEARVLGDGILKMNTEFFPLSVLAQRASKSRKTTRANSENDAESIETKNVVKGKMQDIETTRSMLKEVYDLLLSEKDSEEMKIFELASHTFGTANLMNHLTLFDRFFEEYQTHLSSKKK